MDQAYFSRTHRRVLFVALVLTSSACRPARAEAPRAPADAPVEPSAQDTSPQAEAESELQTGIALTRSGHFAEAIPHFRAAQGRVSNEYSAEFNLALCYVGINQFPNAIPILICLRN